MARASIVSITLATLLLAGQAAAAQSAADLRLQALDAAYNLDHPRAIELLRRAVAVAPSDPAPRRTLAAVLWLTMLFKRGAVTVDHYLGSFSRGRVNLSKPPPELEAEFKASVSRAIELARARVRAAPRDPQARYDLGAALGLEASFIATVEGRLLAGVRAAARAYDQHERVLALDPAQHDAGLIVGTYRYLVASLPLPMRVMAYVVGFGGGKDEGIRLLQRAAAGRGDARTDAMFALVLVYNRERRYDDALNVLRELRVQYPWNRLLLLESGGTALRAGRAAEAEALLTEGLDALSRDGRQRIPGEESLWKYKRGAARAALGRPDAEGDLRAALAPDAQPWVAGRARVELGRLALKRGDGPAARTEATQALKLCEAGNDPQCVHDARRLLRNAHGR